MSASMMEWKRQLRVLQRQVDICRNSQPRGPVHGLSDEQKEQLYQQTRDAEDALRVHYDKLRRH